ncbi:phage tail fiber protein, partial [Enterobacter hormaechei]|uniref:phage tail fiber protein n=3 Tax=Enterobacter cloacae complex TaxID=354276 RepID=UPI003F94CD3C
RNERDGLADGEPVDIPAHQFVSVRVEMPVDSIWNQKQSQQEESVKQEQGS